MVSISALRIAFIVLQVSSTVLITLLLATQYFFQIKRHPVISALLVGDILRSLLGALPGFLWQSLDQHVTGFVNDNAVARMCGIDGLLYAYFLCVRIAFNVSFSICVFLIVRRAESPEEVSSELPRYISLALAVAPYLWALPVIFIPVPTLVRTGGRSPPAAFNDFLCILLSDTLLVVSGYLLWIPLGFAIVLSVAILFLILRFYHRHQNALLSRRTPDYSLILRLGAMAGLLTTTAVFFSIINIPYTQARINLIRTSIFWQALSTFLEIFILIQAQVICVWKGWARKLVGRTTPTIPPSLPPDPEYPTHADHPILTSNSSTPNIPPYKPSRVSLLFDSLRRVLHGKEISQSSTIPSANSGHNANKIVIGGIQKPPPTHPSYNSQHVVIPRSFPSIEQGQTRSLVTSIQAADPETRELDAGSGLALEP